MTKEQVERGREILREIEEATKILKNIQDMAGQDRITVGVGSDNFVNKSYAAVSTKPGGWDGYQKMAERFVFDFQQTVKARILLIEQELKEI